MLNTTQRAQHGYTVTELHTKLGSVFGVIWYDTGEHNCRWDTAEEAETYAERVYNNSKHAE
jgi:hypothetical protein